MSIPLPKTEILLALLPLLCVSAPAAAQGTDDYPANWCRNGLFPSDEAGFKLAKVGGNRTARVHFFNDDDCPRYEAKRETKRYLITGDQVLVSRTYGRWVCGWYQPRKGGETVGWLLADKLVVSEPPARRGGEVCVGRIRGADPAAAPDTYRLVFTLLEADPEDENDFGGGVSGIFDPVELMLLLSRMEREGVFATGAKDVRNDPRLLLTYKTTREIEAPRRANARGLALIDQLMRFAGADGNLSEESLRNFAMRTWFRRSPERFDAGSLRAGCRLRDSSRG